MFDSDRCFHCEQALTGFVGSMNTVKADVPYHINSTQAPPKVNPERNRAGDRSLASRYPQYYKPIGQLKEVDVYAVCMLFPVDDPSGAINHARKKLLIPGVRTGGKSLRKDVQEAVDTLNRWLQLTGDDGKSPSVPLPTLPPLNLQPK
jgi:hypothetical protein